MAELTPKGVIVKGYKATDKNTKCRDYQFTVGEWHEHDGELELCESGFHFCEYPSGPWCYYGEGRLWNVEAEIVLKSEGPGADLKHVARRIRLVSEVETGSDRNTGNRNTGDGNTGDWNTGDGNTGNRNTGNRNTGNGNCGDYHSGMFCHGEAPFFMFGKPAKRDDVDRYTAYRLADKLTRDDDFDYSEFLTLPNASVEAIRELHEAHKKARAERE